MGQPPTVSVIGLVPFPVLHFLGVSQVDLHHIFQNIKHGLPIRPRAFHHHMSHALALQPAAQFAQRPDRRAIAPFLYPWLPLQRPTITQTAKNFLWTSIPAQRSTAALIIALVPFWRRAIDVSYSDLLPRLDCSIRGFLTSTRPVCFSGLTARHYPFRPPSSASLIVLLAPIFITGGDRRVGHECLF